MAPFTPPGLWTVRFEVEKGLAQIPETANVHIGLMDGLSMKSSGSLGELLGMHKHPELRRTPSACSTDTTLNSPQGSIASSSSSSAKASRRMTIEEIFFQFTLDNLGERALSTVDLGTVIHYLGHRLTDEELQKVTQEADADGGGSLDFMEFVAMAERLDASAEQARIAAVKAQARLFSTPPKNAREREFRRVFVMCMHRESQTVATKDLGVVIRLLGYNLTEEELQKIALEADEDGGGSLDLEEFLSMAASLDESHGRRGSK